MNFGERFRSLRIVPGTFQVTSQAAGTFTYSQPCTNGSSSGGTVSAASPTFCDGLGNYFFYAGAGSYAVQVYGNAVNTMGFPDQFVGTPSLLSRNNAWTGNETHSGTETFTSANQIQFADQYANVQAAINALPASGGIVYVTSLLTNTNLGTLDPGNKSMTLYLGAQTYTFTSLGTGGASNSSASAWRYRNKRTIEGHKLTGDLKPSKCTATPAQSVPARTSTRSVSAISRSPVRATRDHRLMMMGTKRVYGAQGLVCHRRQILAPKSSAWKPFSGPLGPLG